MPDRVTDAPDTPLVLQLTTDGGEGRTSPKARGLALARRIATTSDMAQQALIKVRSAKVDGRKSCVRQLKKLLAALEAVEADALTAGVSTLYAQDVVAVLRDADDKVSAVVDRKGPAKEHRVRRLKKEVRHARRRLEALLGASPAAASTEG